MAQWGQHPLCVPDYLDSGCLRYNFKYNKECPAIGYRQLYQIDLTKNTALAALVRVGFYLDIFSIRVFSEDVKGKPENVRLTTLGKKTGWWSYTDWIVVVNSDGTVEVMSDRRAMGKAIISICEEVGNE